jgi:hypothetical protein
MFSDHIVSWLLLALFLIALIYALIVVAEEKETFLETAVDFDFHGFHFSLPSWWSLTVEEEKLIQWERTDTRYDWKAKLEWIESYDKSISIEEDFKNHIEELQMIFDLDASDIKMPSDFENHPSVVTGDIEIVRIEGTATRAQVSRCYLDAFLIRDITRDKALFATSLSSVLNGVVEGPYFEQMMMNIKRNI